MADKLMYKGEEYRKSLFKKVLDFSNLGQEMATIGAYKYWTTNKDFEWSSGTIIEKGEKIPVLGELDGFYIVAKQEMLQSGQLAILKSDVAKLGGYCSNLLSLLYQALKPLSRLEVA